MTEFNLFCYAKKYNDKDSFQQARWRAFNKVVGEKRWKEIRELIRTDILKDLRLELNKNSWIDEWKKVSIEKWIRIQKEIPEFDKEIVEKIIGFKLDLEEPEEMVSIKISKKTLECLRKDNIL